MNVLECIIHSHNIWLVLLAGAVCLAGSGVTARLFLRTLSTSGTQRAGWYFLTALTAGVATWCTHFVAMLGFYAGAPVEIDPFLTTLSLLIAILGSTAGLVLAGSGLTRFAPIMGGGVVGMAIAAMHYTGMMAYRVQGLVSWDKPGLIASILLSVGLSAMALHFALRPGKHASALMTGILSLAIVTLHFTGMAAFRVTPSPAGHSGMDMEAMALFAFAITAMGFVIVAAGLVTYLIDDSVRTESMERLRHMAMSDTLTSLPNRANFNERLDLEIALAHKRGGKFALIGIDLNRFKEINDLHGHSTGDEVLRALGRRMRGLVREEEGEFIARTGGDEFSAICRMDDTRDVSDFVARLEALLSRPINVDGFELISGASLGAAIYPDDATGQEALINNTDLAMYRAKMDPTRTFCFYEPSMDESVRARRALAAELRDASKRNQLSVHYQVQTAVPTGAICGYEALLRWEHPKHGFIPPSEFIPIAEENGLILEIGEWVLRQACAAAAQWAQPYKIAVNVSPMQFVHSNLPQLIASVLADTGLSPDRLEIELTESTIFADRERALHVLNEIKALGVSVALDDFGTGYSSLDTLRSFPFDKIKLDRSFVGECSPQSTAIIRAVLALGKSLNVPVLAEGIETEEQLDMLDKEGCDEAQGYLLGRPAPLDNIVATGQITLTGDGLAA